MNCFEGFRFLFQILKAAIFPWISYTEAIICRKLLYGNPDRLSPKISYDGKYLAFMAPKDDVMNIFVCDPKDPNNKEKIKAVTSAKYHGIREYYWTYGNEILYSQDYKGDEYYKIYAFIIDTNQTKCLTPFNKTQSRLVHLSPKFPQDAIIKINKPDPTAYSLYKINIITGVYALIESSEYSFTEYVVDDSLKFRCATKITDDGGKEIYLKNQDSGKWELLITYGMDDTRSSYVISLDTSGNMYLVDSRDKEFNAIYKLDTNDKEKKLQLVAMPYDQKADINKILLHPTKRIPIAYSVAYLKDDWYPIDEKISLDLKVLREYNNGELDILSQTSDNSIWIIAFESGNQPPKYYLYDRFEQSIFHLFDSRPELEKYALGQVFPLIIKSRDQLDLVCYLTLPPGEHDSSTEYMPKHPLPLVLRVHGGPWTRDYYSFKVDSQFFASRGYAVLNVNFRSSVGLGKTLIRKGIGEWGKKMNDDLIVAVEYLISKNIVIKEKVAIYGVSYGGYATLASLAGLSLTKENDAEFTFACGIEYSGPSDLVQLVENMPEYWSSSKNELMYRLVGERNITKEEKKKILKSHSPINYINQITKPLLIAHGKNDPRVIYSGSEKIAHELHNRSTPIAYILYDDEGHGLLKPANRYLFAAFREKFLSIYLGGKFEEFDFNEDDIKNLNDKIIYGKKLLGLNNK